MRTNAVLAVTLGTVLAGCGSSSEPTMPAFAAVVPPTDAGPKPAPAPAPKRAMKVVGLFGDQSIHNLLIDHTFDTGNPGIGRWYSNLGTGLSGNGPDVSSVVTSSSPEGMSLAVGAVWDTPDSGSPRTFTVLAQVPGGTGPYVVSVWLSTEKPLEGELATLARVSFAAATGSGGLTGAEIPLDDTATRVIEGRTWFRYQGEVATSPALGAFLVLRFRGSKNHWWMQAPSVVPKPLSTGKPASLSLARQVELDDAERAAVQAYRRIPLDLGLGKPR